MIDRDQSTSWGSDVYSDPVPFPSFEGGVVLMLQLPKPTVVDTVTIDTASTGTRVEIRSSATPAPAKLADTTLLTSATALKPGQHNTHNRVLAGAAPGPSG